MILTIKSHQPDKEIAANANEDELLPIPKENTVIPTPLSNN